MARISAITPYGTYSVLNQSGYSLTGTRATNLSNSYNTDYRQIDNLFSSVKLLTAYARNQVQAMQESYRTQIKEFTTAAKQLASSAGAIAALPEQANASKALESVRQAVKDFNSVGNTLSQAETTTAKGRSLYNELQAAAAVREDELKTIGIAYNRRTGELAVDGLKFKQAVTDDYQKVKDTLGGASGFGAAVQEAIRPAVTEPVSGYLANPATSMVNTYSQWQGSSNLSAIFANYSGGLFLDLLA